MSVTVLFIIPKPLTVENYETSPAQACERCEWQKARELVIAKQLYYIRLVAHINARPLVPHEIRLRLRS
jgi:hypothetical protein